MSYKVEFQINCTMATEQDIKQQLTLLQFPDVADIVSFPYRLKVTKLSDQ